MNRLHLLIGLLSLTLFAYAQERNHLPSNSINQYIEQDKVISIDTVVSINLKIVEPDQNSSTYKVVKCISKDYVYDTTYINYVWDLNTTNINHLKSSLANDSENTPAWTEDIWPDEVQSNSENISLPTETEPEIVLETDNIWSDEVQSSSENITLPTETEPEIVLETGNIWSDEVQSSSENITLPTETKPEIVLETDNIWSDEALSSSENITLPTETKPKIVLETDNIWSDEVQSSSENITLPTETKPEIVLETDNIWSDEVQSNDNQVLDKEEEKVTLPFKEINTSGRSIGLNLIRLQNANPNEEPKSLMKVRVPEYTLASKTYQALYIDHNAGRSSTHSIKEVVSINYELIFTPNTLLKLKDVASLLRKNKTLSCIVVFNNRIVKPNDTSGLEFCSQRILKNLNQKHGISKSRLMIFHSSSKLNQFDNVVVLHVDEQPKKVR